MLDIQYDAQTQLLLRCLPELERCACFALKGGTAIDLIARDLPRVSVDIDLVHPAQAAGRGTHGDRGASARSGKQRSGRDSRRTG